MEPNKIVRSPVRFDPQVDRGAMGLALAASRKAKCTRRQVGAVLYHWTGFYLGEGWNAAPTSWPTGCEQGGCPRGIQTTNEIAAYAPYDVGSGICVAVHAEVRALLSVTPRARLAATMYVTAEPCIPCWSIIEEAGIWRVVYPGHDYVIVRDSPAW